MRSRPAAHASTQRAGRRQATQRAEPDDRAHDDRGHRDPRPLRQAEHDQRGPARHARRLDTRRRRNRSCCGGGPSTSGGSVRIERTTTAPATAMTGVKPRNTQRHRWCG